MKNLPRKVSSFAHPNIAFIKYWGNAKPNLRIPSNGSISMNLGDLSTQTTVFLDPSIQKDVLKINGIEQSGSVLSRTKSYLDLVRRMYSRDGYLDIESVNNFPMSAGIASSASAFAALAVAINEIFGLDLNESGLSSLARLGSGSACRSIPSGFCEWNKGKTHESSYAESIASETHWDLCDCIMVVDTEPKIIGSTHGHLQADTSPLQSVRIHDAPRRLAICRAAILKKDFEKFADIIEQDSNMMHAVMMTSSPPIVYWQPTTIAIMKKVGELRKKGTAAAYTMDAGANVHVICPGSNLKTVQTAFHGFAGVRKIFTSKVGCNAKFV